MSRVALRILDERGDETCPAVSSMAEGFSSLALWDEETDGGDMAEVRIASDEWLDSDADLLEFDRLFRGTEPFGSFVLTIFGEARELQRAVPGILTRYQRLFPRKNAYSESAFFSSVLAFHRAVHPIEKQRVRAEYDHALDVWQWVLRLRPDANLAVQLAALFHDIERLLSGTDRRIEHHAVNGREIGDERAKRGGDMVRRILRRLEAWPLLVERVAMLVERHERLDGGEDLALLEDADALSFFSLDSADFLDRHGRAETALQVEDALARMRPEARELLSQIRHPRGVEELLRRAHQTTRMPSSKCVRSTASWSPVVIS